MKMLKAVIAITVGLVADSFVKVYAQMPPCDTPGSPALLHPEKFPLPETRSEISEPFSLKPVNLMNVPPGVTIGITVATILKILLKLLIFKMIVKFMAFICALLYLPAFSTTTEMSPPEPTTLPPITTMPTTMPPVYSHNDFMEGKAKHKAFLLFNYGTNTNLKTPKFLASYNN